MNLVLGHVIRVYEDIIKVYYYTNIQHVTEDVIHKSLKGGGSIGKSKQNYQPFKGAVASAKGGFPFIAIRYANQMVGMMEVDFGKNISLLQGIEEVQNQG